MISKAPLSFMKIIFFVLIPMIQCFGQTVVIDDPLMGSTIGTQVGGTLSQEGFAPRIGKFNKAGFSEDHILYNIGHTIDNGYVEFQVKGFNMNDFQPTSSNLPSRENGFITLYDGRGVTEPLNYDPDAKHNYFYWVIHYRSEKYQSTAGNKWKAIINCAEPRPERINSNRAVFTDATGDFGLVNAKDGVLNILDRDWTVEPNGLRTIWDPNKWYTMKIEWRTNQFKVYLDGQVVWFNELEEGQPWTGYDNSTPQAIYPWKPVNFRIWLGSGPGRYDNDMPNIIYKNFKVVDYANSPPPSPSISVISPNGGEALSVGSNYQIRWISNLINYVKINYSINNGLDWISISDSTLSDGIYSWVVPNLLSSECIIKIEDLDSSEINDISNGVFTIRQESTDTNLVIISPNGGEEWLTGRNQVIRWNEPLGTNNVIIFFSTDYDLLNTTQATWTTIGTSANTGSYIWQIPNKISNNCVIRIKDANNFSDVDISDSLFTIRNYSPSLSLVNPNGGEVLVPDSSYLISWESKDVNRIKIEYSINGGVDWLLVADSVSNESFYNWVVPITESDSCLIKISDIENNVISDIADSTFAILPLISPSLTLISPIGGESFIQNTSVDLMWESVGVANVKLEFTSNNGNDWLSIVDSTVSDGNFTWTAPNIISSNCKIRITDLSDSNLFIESEGLFTIKGLTDIINNDNVVPSNYSLGQNYPNPFNPTTNISYAIPEPTKVEISVYNILGKKVKSLVNKYHAPGFYNIKFSGNNFPSGPYFYRMQSKSFNKSLSMLLIK